MTSKEKKVQATFNSLYFPEFPEVKTQLESHISAGQELFNFYVNRALPFSGTLGSITKKQIEELSYHKCK